MFRNLTSSARRWALRLLAPAAFWLASSTPAFSQEIFSGGGGGMFAGFTGFSGFGGGSCGSCETGCCQTHHCPPPLQHCMERPPKIHVKCGCPRPICNPCTQPGWGYYETCWSPWPWPPDYNHCATLPPAATIALSGPHPYGHPFTNTNTGTGVPDAGYSDPRLPVRPTPSPVTPSMPPVTSPPIPTTPGLPRLTPSPLPNPGMNPGIPMPLPNPGITPTPGAGIESLPVPRNENPRPLPPGGF